MKFMVLVKSTPSSELGGTPDLAMMQAMGRFNDELAEAGVLVAVDGLLPSSKGVRVHFSGKDRTVSSGPFGNPENLVCGYWIWECESFEEAIEWAKRCPNPHADECHLEIRQVARMEDFGEEFARQIRKS